LELQELETANKMSYMEKQKELQDGNGQLNNFNSQQQQIQAMHTVAVYNAQASQTERFILNAEMRGASSEDGMNNQVSHIHIHEIR